MKYIDISDAVNSIIQSPPDMPGNSVDTTLRPVASYQGTDGIKLIIIGQDPTVRRVESRRNIKCTLNLDNPRGALYRYLCRICDGLDITIENIYATNIFKYFYTVPPADTPEVLTAHLEPNLKLLREEMSRFPECSIVTLGEPVLQLLTDDRHRVRDCWNYLDCGYRYITASDNKINRTIFPFPHITSMTKALYKENLQSYLEYMRRQI